MTHLQSIKEEAVEIDSLSFRLLVFRIQAIEWIHCLVSARHAESTWLRIDPQVEEKYIALLRRGILLLFVAIAFVVGMIAGQYRMLNHLQSQQPIQIQLQTKEI